MAAVEHVFASILRRSEKRAARALDADDVLEPMVRDATEYFFGGDFLAAFDVLMSVSKSGSKKTVRNIGTRLRVPAEEIWLNCLVARGLDRPLADDVVWIAFSVIRGLAIRTLLEHEPDRLQRTIDVVLEMLRARIADDGKSHKSDGQRQTGQAKRRNSTGEKHA